MFFFHKKNIFFSKTTVNLCKKKTLSSKQTLGEKCFYNLWSIVAKQKEATSG